MTMQQCEQWTDIADREAVGESISDEERVFYRAHLESCPVCRDEADLWDQMSANPEDRQAPTIEQLMAQVPQQPIPLRPMRHRTLIIGGVVAAAMAASVLIVLSFSDSEPQEQVEVASAAAPTVITGDWTVTNSEPQCQDRDDGAQLCLGPRSKARSSRVEGVRDGYEVVLGTIAIDLPPRQDQPPFVIVTPAGDVEALGTIFAVEVSSEGQATTHLLEGRLSIQAAGVDRVVITAGESILLGSPAPSHLEPEDGATLRTLLGQTLPEDESPTTPSDEEEEETVSETAVASRGRHGRSAQEPPESVTTPSDLLQRARQLRLERRHREAAAAYGELQRSHPGSAEARTSLVSLGQLQLSHLGAPADALRSFDTYLGRGGALEREALFGRIRALRALGRTGEERNSIESYLSRFSSDVRAAPLRSRLEDLR